MLQKRKLLLLDEPTVGLDPKGIDIFYKLIKRLADEEGTAFIISSHQLKEIDTVVTRYLLIKDAQLIERKDIFDKKIEIILSSENWNEDKTRTLSQSTNAKIIDKNIVVVNNDEELVKVINEVNKLHGNVEKVKRNFEYQRSCTKMLVRSELFKLIKKKMYILPILIAFLPLVLAIIIYINPKDLHISGEFSSISFGLSMWQFLWAVFLPQLVVIYLTSESNKKEEENGQIIYEITKVKDNWKIIISKLIAQLVLILLFAVLFLDTKIMIQKFILSIIAMAMIACITYLFNTYFKSIVTIILMFAAHTLVNMLTGLLKVWYLLPSSILYKGDYKGDYQTLALQITILIVVGIGAVIWKKRALDNMWN